MLKFDVGDGLSNAKGRRVAPPSTGSTSRRNWSIIYRSMKENPEPCDFAQRSLYQSVPRTVAELADDYLSAIIVVIGSRQPSSGAKSGT